MRFDSKVYNLANLLTLLNLISGCIGIFFVLNNNFSTLHYFILFSLIMDFFDGFIARHLGISSNIGKDLDSLADVVSFGLLPTMMMVQILKVEYQLYDITIFNMQQLIIILSPIIITAFTALRLARFNSETRDSKFFYGLNSPMNAIFFLGLFYSWHYQLYSIHILINTYPILISIVSIIMSVMLLTDFKMISIKIDFSKITDNKTLIIFGLYSLLTLILFKYTGLMIIVISYIVLCILQLNILNKNDN